MGHLIYNANIDHSATFVYRIKLPRHVENVIMQAMSLNFALAQQKHKLYNRYCCNVYEYDWITMNSV